MCTCMCVYTCVYIYIYIYIHIYTYMPLDPKATLPTIGTGLMGT